MPVVTRKSSGRVVVVSQDTILNVIDNRPAVAVVERGATVGSIVERKSTVTTTARGPQGPQGEPGLSGGGVLPVLNFSYGDASPRELLELAVASEVVSVSLEIEVAFNGVAPQIQLGTAADPALLMAAWENAADVVGVYEVAPRVELLAGEALVLSLTPGAGASQGRGQFVINAVPSA